MISKYPFKPKLTDFDIVKKLGEGAYGTAYLLTNNKVLKITNDESEYEIAKKLITKNPNWAAKIYWAERNKNKYFIIKELVKPIYPNKDRGEYNQDERFTFWGKTKKLETIFINKKGIYPKNLPETTKNYERKLAVTPHKMCVPDEWGQRYYLRKLTSYEMEKIQSLYNSYDKKINKWFMINFWKAKDFGAYTKDLYSNIGISSNGNFVFFDLA